MIRMKSRAYEVVRYRGLCCARLAFVRGIVPAFCLPLFANVVHRPYTDLKIINTCIVEGLVRIT